MIKIITLIIAICFLSPIISKAQAHLGSTLSEIKSKYPDKNFKINVTNDGQKYTTAKMGLGEFVYYFDKETNLSNLVIQIPNNMTALNTQVEIYNKKYVIVSEVSWKAYLEGGGIMYIDLQYNKDLDSYIFYYTN